MHGHVDPLPQLGLHVTPVPWELVYSLHGSPRAAVCLSPHRPFHSGSGARRIQASPRVPTWPPRVGSQTLWHLPSHGLGSSSTGHATGRPHASPSLNAFQIGEPTPSPVAGNSSAPGRPSCLLGSWPHGDGGYRGTCSCSTTRPPLDRATEPLGLPSRLGQASVLGRLCLGVPGREGDRGQHSARRAAVNTAGRGRAELLALLLSASPAPRSAPEARMEAGGCDDSCLPPARFFRAPRLRSRSPRNHLPLPGDLGRASCSPQAALTPRSFSVPLRLPRTPLRWAHGPATTSPASGHGGHSLGSSPRPPAYTWRTGRPPAAPPPTPSRVLTSLPEGAALTARQTSRGMFRKDQGGRSPVGGDGCTW